MAEHVLDHAAQAHLLTVGRGVDAGHAVGLEQLDLFRDDDAAAAGKDAYARAVALGEHVHHVPQVFDVPALIRADGDTLHILLQGRIDDLGH